MLQLYESMHFADVWFKPQDDGDNLIAAHKFVIAARCPTAVEKLEFSKIHSDEWTKGIPVPFGASTMKLFLQFVYVDALNLSDEAADSEIPHLTQLAQLWHFPDLEARLQKYTGTKQNVDSPSPKPATSAESTLPKLNSDLRRSLIASSSDFHSFDVKFVITMEPGKVILAHKAILIHRSPYFSAMFTGGTKERTSFELEMHDIKHLAMLTVLEYCYTDDIRYINGDMAAELLIAASHFCLTRLKRKIAAFIVNGITLDNVPQIYRLGCDSDTDSLIDYCTFYIARCWNTLSAVKSKFTKDEIEKFENFRSKWPNADDMEEDWIASQKQEEDLPHEKKCYIM